jgi:hypothetical protein
MKITSPPASLAPVLAIPIIKKEEMEGIKMPSGDFLPGNYCYYQYNIKRVVLMIVV